MINVKQIAIIQLRANVLEFLKDLEGMKLAGSIHRKIYMRLKESVEKIGMDDDMSWSAISVGIKSIKNTKKELASIK